MGFLTGSLDENTRFTTGDFRAAVPRFAPVELKANLKLVDLVRKWAKRKEATLSQISLAWLMAQKPWIVPIPGTTKGRHMLENLGAHDVSFTAEELREFNGEVDRIKIKGDRLPANLLAASGVEAPLKK